MPSESFDSVSITLSPAQVDEVVRAAHNGAAPAVSALVRRRFAPPEAPDAEGENGHDAAFDERDDRRLSRSLIRGLALLGALESSQPRGIVEIARDLDMSASTAHRYAITLVELGLIERCPRTRKYRLAAAG